MAQFHGGTSANPSQARTPAHVHRPNVRETPRLTRTGALGPHVIHSRVGWVLSALVVVHNARYNSFVLVLLHARNVEACNIPANLFALVKERAHMEVTCEGKLASFNLCREYKSILLSQNNQRCTDQNQERFGPERDLI